MKRTLPCLSLLLAPCAGIYAQSAAFDVAPVKRNPAGNGPTTRMKETTGRVDFMDVPLKWVIRRAYQVQDGQISGPDWLDSEGYDIAATVSARNNLTAAQWDVPDPARREVQAGSPSGNQGRSGV
ncbi:exported hypothetical protein [Candidatus Sulfopaludibacter sp. SbA3]|nr:exported hypothetical protein [Candidatus Sulfopaludibacter sp. SbA3]